MGGRGPVHHPSQELGLKEWSVDCDHQVQVRLGCTQCCVDAAERTRIGKDILDRIRTEARAIADNGYSFANTGEESARDIEQSLATKLQESLVCAHTRALPACEDKSRRTLVDRLHGGIFAYGLNSSALCCRRNPR